MEAPFLYQTAIHTGCGGVLRQKRAPWGKKGQCKAFKIDPLNLVVDFISIVMYLRLLKHNLIRWEFWAIDVIAASHFIIP